MRRLRTRRARADRGRRRVRRNPGEGTVRETFTVAGQQFEVVVPEESVQRRRGRLAMDHPRRRPRPRRSRGGARGQRGAASQGAGGARPHLHALARSDRGRRLRGTFHARQPGRGAGARLHAGGVRSSGRTSTSSIRTTGRGQGREAAAIGRGRRRCRSRTATSARTARTGCSNGRRRRSSRTRLMYGMARDVTERRQAETEVERLADEQAALRRVATLVAEVCHRPGGLRGRRRGGGAAARGRRRWRSTASSPARR